MNLQYHKNLSAHTSIRVHPPCKTIIKTWEFFPCKEEDMNTIQTRPIFVNQKYQNASMAYKASTSTAFATDAAGNVDSCPVISPILSLCTHVVKDSK